MQTRHKNPENYFNEQALSGERYYVPYIESHVHGKGKVLEIGCGWGGGLSAFAAHGYDVYGVDIQQRAVEFAQNIFATKGLTGTFVCADIFDYTSVQKFDIIILHDAIEHIPNKESLMLKIRDLLSPGGIVYVAFPPWQMPFGGHQQVAKSKILSNIPYTHLLPRPIFWSIFRLFGESKSAIRYFFELRDTGISIERFEKLVNRTGYSVKDRQLWFINPNYQTKFGLKPRKQSGFITATPRVRNFVTTTCYYLLSANAAENKG